MAHAAAGLSGIRKRDFSICPIEEPLEFDALVAESRKVSGAAHTVDLLCFDAGLRLGEATALRWEDRSFGRDATGTTRSLRISASRSSDLYLGNTRSERERSVAMPRRLRRALLAYQLATTHAGLEGAPTGARWRCVRMKCRRLARPPRRKVPANSPHRGRSLKRQAPLRNISIPRA
jgi:integrase